MSNIFSKIASGEEVASVVYDDPWVMAFMDLFPCQCGHVLVIAKQNAQHLHELDAEHKQRLFDLASRIGRALRSQPVRCDDLNFIINDGKLAGQTVPHVHMDVIPRVKGDLARVSWQVASRPLNIFRRPNRQQLDQQAQAIAAALAVVDAESSADNASC